MDFAKFSCSILCVFIFFIYEVYSENLSALEALWDLTGFAIQSRRSNQYYPIKPIAFPNNLYGNSQVDIYKDNKNINKYPVYAGNYKKFNPYLYPPHIPNSHFLQNQGGYGPHNLHPPHIPNSYFLQNQANYGALNNFGYPKPHLGYPQQDKIPLASFLPSRESFMEALDSIARNDELHCVPRILCEVTSGTLSARKNGRNLPFNINLDSIAGLLSGFDSTQLNPLLSFGKAAVLGYSSKGNAGTCMYAYPECPRDPEKLVEYLNNYNGGFFRFFNGINPDKNGFYRPPPHFQRPPVPSFHRPGINRYRPYEPHMVYNYKANEAEKRILTRPTELDFASNSFPEVHKPKGIKFPNDIDEFDNELHLFNNFRDADSSRTLRFPIRGQDDREGPLRQPKRLPQIYNGIETDYQRPKSDHRPTPMIFPDRTGTGELKFSPEELEEDFRRPAAFQNINLISFGGEDSDSHGYNWNNHFFPV